MAASQASSHLMDRVSCDVCMEPFDNTSHMPKLLPCEHTFCQRCIAQATNSNSCPASIKCPTCRCQHTVPSIGFTTNRVALDLADELLKDPKTSETTESLKCEKHATKEAVLVCIQCLHGLCLTCVKTSSHSHRDHDLQELDDAVPILQKTLRENAEAKTIGLQEEISHLRACYADMTKAENDIKDICEGISSEVEGWAGGHISTITKLKQRALNREKELLLDIPSMEQKQNDLSTLICTLSLVNRNDGKQQSVGQPIESQDMSKYAESKFSESIRNLETNVVSILTSRDSLQNSFRCKQATADTDGVGNQMQHEMKVDVDNQVQPKKVDVASGEDRPSGDNGSAMIMLLYCMNFLGIIVFAVVAVVYKFISLNYSDELCNAFNRSIDFISKGTTILLVFQIVNGFMILSNEYMHVFKELVDHLKVDFLTELYNVLLKEGDALKFKLLVATQVLLIYALLCYMLFVSYAHTEDTHKVMECHRKYWMYSAAFWSCYTA